MPWTIIKRLGPSIWISFEPLIPSGIQLCFRYSEPPAPVVIWFPLWVETAGGLWSYFHFIIILRPMLFLIYVIYLSDSLENHLYHFANDSPLSRTIHHSCEKLATAESISSDLDSINRWSATWSMMFNFTKSHAVGVSPQGVLATGKVSLPGTPRSHYRPQNICERIISPN